MTRLCIPPIELETTFLGYEKHLAGWLLQKNTIQAPSMNDPGKKRGYAVRVSQRDVTGWRLNVFSVVKAL